MKNPKQNPNLIDASKIMSKRKAEDPQRFIFLFEKVYRECCRFDEKKRPKFSDLHETVFEKF
jgi:hypothetical protein